MKLIIFAGGHGTRLWPLSRKNTPKQFESLFEGKSTLQLAVNRVQDIFGIENIYISSNEQYKKLIFDQIKELPENNFLSEPVKRDQAAAVGLSLMKLKNNGYTGPIAILWADHLMKNVEEFQKALAIGEELINENPNRFIFIGEKPRFPNHNLGWITVGEEITKKNEISVLEFKNWIYRPEIKICKQLFEEGKSYWNPGYFITSVDFVLSLYETKMPDMFQLLEKMGKDSKLIDKLYPTVESISFDDAIVTKTKPEQAVVLSVDMGWSDPGTLYALKEALQKTPAANVSQGNVFNLKSKDCLVINRDEAKLITTIGLEGMIIINTKDAAIIVHKDNVPKVKELVTKLDEKDLRKYI